MDKELNIKIKVGTQPLKDFKEEIRKAKEELARLDLQGKKNSKEYRDQQKYINALSSELKKLEQSGKQAAKGLEQTRTSLSDTITKFGLATAGLVVVARQLTEAIQQGAKLSVLREGFQGTAFDLEMLRKATANTVNEGDLIALSNQASDLGLSLTEQAKLFALAEDAGDKYGGSIEENFQKIVAATDGRAGGLRKLGIAVKEYNEKLLELQKAENVKIDQLSAEAQLQLRLQAIFELTGTSLDTVKNKTVDVADSMEQLGRAFEIFTTGLGEGFVNGMTESGQAAQDFSKDLEMLGEVAKDIGSDIGTFVKDVWRDINWLADQASNVLADLFEATMSEELKQQRRVDLRIAELEKKSIEENQYGPFITDEQREALKKRGRDTLPQNTTGSNANTTAKETKVIQTEIAKVLADQTRLEAERSQLIAEGYDNTLAYYNLLNRIYETSQKLAGLQLPLSTLAVTATAQNIIGEGRAGFDLFPVSPQVQASTLAEDSKIVYDNITNILNSLGLATDNFVSTLINGFNTVLTIMESVKAVNSILSIIPFLATGGTMMNTGLAVVGERGPELVSLPGGSRVYNNADSRRMMSSMMAAPAPVNVYINASGLASYHKTELPKYFDKRNYTRIN